MKMTRYNEKDADRIDKIIHWALNKAAERLSISEERKVEMRNRIRKEKRNENKRGKGRDPMVH